MGFVTSVFIFILVWWLVIFTVLPWGNRALDNPQVGHAASAPANPRIRLKLMITTIISLAITGIIYGVVTYTDWSFVRMMQSWSEQ